MVTALVSINEVNLRRARLVLRWATMSGFNSRCRTLISVCPYGTHIYVSYKEIHIFWHICRLSHRVNWPINGQWPISGHFLVPVFSRLWLLAPLYCIILADLIALNACGRCLIPWCKQQSFIYMLMFGCCVVINSSNLKCLNLFERRSFCTLHRMPSRYVSYGQR